MMKPTNQQPAVNPDYKNIENIPVHLISSEGRECGTCTKCCEGWLLADIDPEIPENRSAGSIGHLQKHILVVVALSSQADLVSF